MNKTIKKLFAAGLTAALCLSSMIPSFAAGSNYGTTLDGDSVLTTTLDKYLVMREGANVPNVEFEYAITAGTAIAYDTTEGKFQVLAGVDADKITFEWDQYHLDTDAEGPDTDVKSTVRFTSSDTTILFADKGAIDYVKGLEAGEKYAKHTATLNFSQVGFKEPGVYRYVITETGSTRSDIVNDANLSRILDVYVEDATTSDGTKTLKIVKYVLHATVDGIGASEDFGSDGLVSNGTGVTSGTEFATAASDYKSQGFTNEFVTYDLTFSKTVTGNQGSRDKYFKFTVTIEGAMPNTVYTVSLEDDNNANTNDGSNADATVIMNAATLAGYEGKTNPTAGTNGTVDTAAKTITTDANGKAVVEFYLQHGQSICIRGLGKGASYTIVEDSEDYKPFSQVTGDDNASVGENKAIVSSTGIAGDSIVAYENTRGGVIPTGVILTVAPFAVLMAAGAVGIIVVAMKKKHAED